MSGWRAHALCAEVGGESFFPEGGQPSAPARAICAQCPVRSACLEDALVSGDVEFGIRGGKSARERRSLLKKHREAA